MLRMQPTQLLSVVRRAAFPLALSFFSTCLPVRAAEPALKEGDFVAVIGDSITEQKLYSVFIEDYLLMCQPAGKLRTMQFGWGGETAGGFKGRMVNDTLRFGPSVATTCYGMNDGGYSPMTPEKARTYRDNQTGVVEGLKEGGVRFIVVGSPGCVDADTFRRNPEQAVMYNKTLAEERDIARDVAREQGVGFADVFTPMMDVMTKAKAKYGQEYHVAGGDGVHPDKNGHLVMAYAFLKALGCDGDIGTITVDFASDSAEASEGHKVLSHKQTAGDGNGRKAQLVEVESTRYPFCFFGVPAMPSATNGVLQFLPFNAELNRLTLVVKGAQGAKIKVTWGENTEEFSAEDLAKGVNLADRFPVNPFCEPFQSVEKAIRAQQEFETPMVKELIHGLPKYEQLLPEDKELTERLAADLAKKDDALRAAAAAALQPVRHTIRIEAGSEQ